MPYDHQEQIEPSESWIKILHFILLEIILLALYEAVAAEAHSTFSLIAVCLEVKEMATFTSRLPIKNNKRSIHLTASLFEMR